MAKKKKISPMMIVLIIIAFFVFGNGTFFQGAISGSETVTRTLSTNEVELGESFQVTYSVVGGAGDLAVSIEDSIVGDCKFPDGQSTYKDVLTSEDTLTKTITITTPSSTGTCTFTNGDYKFGTFAINNIPSQMVIVGSPECIPDIMCTTLPWSNSAESCGTRTTTCLDDNGCEDTTIDTETLDCPTYECTLEEIGYKIVNEECVSDIICPEEESPDYSTLAACEADLCTDTLWNPSTAEVCTGTNYLQTSNCGNERVAVGIKTCNTGCTDTNYDGQDPSEICSDTTVTHTNDCGDTKEVSGTKDCGTDGGCEFWEKKNSDGECTLNMVFVVVGVILLFFMQLMR